MYVQIVTFTLDGIDEDQYHDACHSDASTFAALPGLLSKIWLRDPAGNTYGGLYLWQDRESYEAYVDGDIFKSIAEEASFAGVESRGFDVFDDLTKVTQPRLAVV